MTDLGDREKALASFDAALEKWQSARTARDKHYEAYKVVLAADALATLLRQPAMPEAEGLARFCEDVKQTAIKRGRVYAHVHIADLTRLASALNRLGTAG